MSKFWSPVVARLTPYVPGEQPKLSKLVKLNTNENPYGPSPAVANAIAAAAGDSLRRYPDPESNDLREALAQAQGLKAEQVFIGNGSDEVLAHVFQALLKHDKAIRFPDITYSFYPVYCALFDIDYTAVSLDQNFEIDIDDYTCSNGGIIFPNPNAPTGASLDRNKIVRCLKANPDSVVVIDEAYIAFGGESAVPLIDEHDNLLVVQTLSKSHGLAGLRVGYAFGQAHLVEGLTRLKDSFNSYPLDSLAQAGACAAIKDQAYFESTRRRIVESRERLKKELEQRAFDVIPSHANFLFATHAIKDAKTIANGLREHGVIVRHFKQARIDNYLRITIGTDEELAELVRALDLVLA